MTQHITAADSRAPFLSRLRSFLGNPRVKAFYPLIGLLLIIAVFSVMTDGKITSARSIKLILSQVYPLMIACTGVFMVMTLGSLDFSQGSIIGMASIVVSALSFYSIPLAILGGLLTGAAIGLFNGIIHVKFKFPRSSSPSAPCTCFAGCAPF